MKQNTSSNQDLMCQPIRRINDLLLGKKEIVTEPRYQTIQELEAELATKDITYVTN